MTSHALFLLLLAPGALSLSSCVGPAVDVQSVSPEFKKAGLRGKTLALGDVLCARPEYDPTAAETAASLVGSESWLEEKRPGTRVVGFVSFGHLMGPLKNRFHGRMGVPLAALTPAQYDKAQAAGVDHVLFIEMEERNSRSGTVERKEEEKVTECDKDGKEEEKTTTHHLVSYATCWVTCRYYVVDVRTRQVVWEAVGTASEGLENKSGPIDHGFVMPPEIPLMPATTAAIKQLTPAVLRRLPK